MCCNQFIYTKVKRKKSIGTTNRMTNVNRNRREIFFLKALNFQPYSCYTPKRITIVCSCMESREIITWAYCISSVTF